MRRLWMLPALAVAALGQEAPSRHEVGLTLGSLQGGNRSGSGTSLDLGSGVAFQANYGFRFFANDNVGLYGEFHFLANPQRQITSTTPSLTRDIATIYATPGIRVKFRPAGPVAPFVAVGGGWALYEQSLTTLDGQPNPAPRTINRGAFSYGGGVDFKFWRFVGLRAEIRNFYSGSPAYNTTAISGGQNNLVIGGGLVLKFGD
jgi:opacity protein-like surface antigen